MALWDQLQPTVLPPARVNIYFSFSCAIGLCYFGTKLNFFALNYLGCLWTLSPAKATKMDEEVLKWSRKDPSAIKRAMAYPGTFF